MKYIYINNGTYIYRRGTNITYRYQFLEILLTI